MLEHRSGLEQQHRDAEIGEHLGDRAAARAGSNHDDVVDGGIVVTCAICDSDRLFRLLWRRPLAAARV